jgi:gliding motility-associated-like protein
MGSLGDPVVNINFGSGSNTTGFAPANAYTFTTNVCPNDGFYTITGSTSGCFNNTWHTITSDHTGHGSFMLVNASYLPADFFLTTITDLCPNTNYEFAAWIMNVLTNRSGIMPFVTFTIETPDGTILQEYQTGNIPQTSGPEWKQYGFYFTTPPDNPVIVLRMRNNAPGGLGNDLALDDITFRPCGPVITSIIEGYKDTVDICEGTFTSFRFAGNASSAYINPAYQWQSSKDSGTTWTDLAGATTESFSSPSFSQTGAYWYRVTVTDERFTGIRSCRIASNNLIINVHPKPFVNAGNDRVSIKGDTIHLSATISGEDPSYYWSPPDYLSDATIKNPVATPPVTSAYTLYTESAFGCKKQDSLLIKVVQGIFVPSAFTPNNDGKNDHWHIPYLDPALGAEVTVFNRYGKVVYHTKGQTVDWDGNINGEPQPTAVYIYQIRFKTSRPDMKGTVSLIR